MDSQILMRLNEIYRHDVYNEEVLSEETLSEEELVDINQWVSQLISEGYDLDDYSDEELYEAYLEDLDEANRAEQRLGKKGLEPVLVRSARMATYYGKPSTSKSDDETMRKHPRYVSGHRRGGDPSLASTNPRTEAHKKRRGVKTRGTGIREELDLYDVVSDYLVSEGFCDSYEDADVIMANMSEEWRESIMEEVLDEANRGEKYLNLSPDEIVKGRQPFLPRGGYKGEEEAHDRRKWSTKGSGSVKGGDPSLGKTVWQGGRKPDGDLDRMRNIEHKRSRGRRTRK